MERAGEKYRLERCSWDITDRCPLNCRHCCAKEEDHGRELSTEEALGIAEQLTRMKVQYVSLTGGEPLVRPDWPLLVSALKRGGVNVSLTTSGWTVDQETVKKMVECGIDQVAVSIDGDEAAHDHIRCQGSFGQCRRVLALMKESGIPTIVITTVLAGNFDSLPRLREELVEMGVEKWQIQLGIPVGNLGKEKGEAILPEQVPALIGFCYETARSTGIRVFPADCIGYYTEKEAYVRQYAFQSERLPVWMGCSGGRRLAHITSSGDVRAVSMKCPGKEVQGVETNLSRRSLAELWGDDRIFAGFRDFDWRKLEGACGKCSYGELCRGGCSMLRMALGGGVYGENPYCAFYQRGMA